MRQRSAEAWRSGYKTVGWRIMVSMKPHLSSLRLLALSIAVAIIALIAAAQPPQAAFSAQDDRMQWFREAKFGLFIHWGLYAIPAGEWKGQPVPGLGEWIMNRGKIPVKEYEQLASQFNPVKFNAEEWVKLAEDAGMKYRSGERRVGKECRSRWETYHQQ